MRRGITERTNISVQLPQSRDGFLSLNDLSLKFDTLALELLLVLIDEVSDTDIIPDNRTRQRLASLAAPHDGSFTLVSDAYKITC